MNRRDWAVAGVTALIVVALALGIYIPFGTDIGRIALGRVGTRVAGLEGIQFLVSRVDLPWAPVRVRVEQMVDSADRLAQAGSYEEAIAAYERAIELAPRETAAYLGLARVYEAQEAWERALETLEKAAEADPGDAQVLQSLGRLHCLRGETEACIEKLEEALAIAPEDAWTHYLLSLAYQQRAEGGESEALAQITEALRLDPTLARGYLILAELYQGRPGGVPLAIEAYEKAIDKAVEAGDEETASRARADLARLYYAEDRYDECIDEWQKILEAEPEDPDAHRRLGLCYGMRAQSGDVERAVAALETALRLDFEQIDAYYLYLGQFYASQEDYPRAFLAFDQFLRLSDKEELKEDVRGWMEGYRQYLEEGP
jgi:tetratricopeptide (TPR) repeat protein